MDARNLAIVFGPTLVRPQDNNMVNMVRDMTDQCRIIESIILHVIPSVYPSPRGLLLSNVGQVRPAETGS